MSDPLRVAIAGCGMIGSKRAEALGTDNLIACYDPDNKRAETLAQSYDAHVAESQEDVLSAGADVVIVATPHDRLAKVAAAALRAGSHVLVEKPAGIGTVQIEELAAIEAETGRVVKVGFNHRFAPGIERAVADARSGEFGDVMFARARYGHGGRVGYEKEWRLRPEVSGGGELVDQGMHLIDIFGWLLGPLPLHSSLTRRHFWDAPVEDNAVFVLADPTDESGPWATAHVSWTEWKNMFSLEIYCRRAKFVVDGLAGSYGPQRLTRYLMKPELGPPEQELLEFPAEDVSWEREWEHFKGLVGGEAGPPLGSLTDALYAWRIVEGAYGR